MSRYGDIRVVVVLAVLALVVSGRPSIAAPTSMVCKLDLNQGQGFTDQGPVETIMIDTASRQAWGDAFYGVHRLGPTHGPLQPSDFVTDTFSDKLIVFHYFYARGGQTHRMSIDRASGRMTWVQIWADSRKIETGGEISGVWRPNLSYTCRNAK